MRVDKNKLRIILISILSNILIASQFQVENCLAIAFCYEDFLERQEGKGRETVNYRVTTGKVFLWKRKC